MKEHDRFKGKIVPLDRNKLPLPRHRHDVAPYPKDKLKTEIAALRTAVGALLQYAGSASDNIPARTWCQQVAEEINNKLLPDLAKRQNKEK